MKSHDRPIGLEAAHLESLSEKYRRMLWLRGAHGRGMEPAPRHILRELSSAFPGALSELDSMESEELEARARALETARETGAPEPWMVEVFAFHRALQAALALKRDPSIPLSELRDRFGTFIDAPFVAALTAKGARRMLPVVLDSVARWTRQDVTEVAPRILPRRRQRPRS